MSIFRNRLTLVLITIGLLCSVLSVSGCLRRPTPTVLFITGNALGANYRVKVLEKGLSSAKIESLHSHITQTLSQLAEQVNPRDAESQISRYNQLAVGENIKIGKSFAQLLALYREFRAKHPAFISAGAGESQNPAIEDWKLSDKGDALTKLTEARIDLEPLVRAFAVDLLADSIQREGFEDFLIEIGTEAHGEGLATEGKPWITGIKISDLRDPVSLALQGRGTGYAGVGVTDPANHPPQNELAGVLVVADSAIQAKATALSAFLLGPEKAKQWLSGQNHLAVLMVFKAGPDSPVRLIANGPFRRLRQSIKAASQ